MTKKKFFVTIDQKSWTSSKLYVPKELSIFDKTDVEIDLLEALHFTGLLTRPPISFGFSLSNFWAWLRYFPAFDPKNEDARFRVEWNSLDRHQKTIASDDLGMGFSTLFLKKALNIETYIDTMHVIKNLSKGKFTFSKVSKNGQFKTPDFVAYHSNGDISIVECKGTQSSRAALLGYLKDGQSQKRNINLNAGHFKHKLVAGTFIPQYNHKDRPLISISDPEWEIEKEFNKYKREEINKVITQLSIAQELSHVELSNLSQSFSKSYENLEDINVAFEKDRRNFKDKGFQENNYNYVKEYSLKWDVPIQIKNKEYTGIKYTTELPFGKIEELRKFKNASDFTLAKNNINKPERWKKKETLDETMSYETESPLGFSYRLEII